MGGERETVVEGKASIGSEVQVGNFRVHEKNGEVHFHSDATGQKCAVPVADFFAAWTRALAHYFDEPIHLIGQDNSGKFVLLRIARNQASHNNGILEVDAFIQGIAMGPTLSKLNQFVGA